jgi:prevent-host-death family protein
MKKIASVAEVKSQFSSFLKASAAGPVVITRHGRPAVIVGVQDEDEIERLLMAYSPRLQAILEKSRKQIREGDVLSHDEFWAEVEASRASKQPGRKRKTGDQRVATTKTSGNKRDVQDIQPNTRSARQSVQGNGKSLNWYGTVTSTMRPGVRHTSRQSLSFPSSMPATFFSRK